MRSTEKNDDLQFTTTLVHTFTLLAAVLALSFIVAIVESFAS